MIQLVLKSVQMQCGRRSTVFSFNKCLAAAPNTAVVFGCVIGTFAIMM